MLQISREALLKNRLRFTASGWVSIITSCLMWSSGSLYISLKNRNSSKAMSARGRNGNKKTAAAWLCMFPCSSGFCYLLICKTNQPCIRFFSIFQHLNQPFFYEMLDAFCIPPISNTGLIMSDNIAN